jgi:hypothetical protein
MRYMRIPGVAWHEWRWLPKGHMEVGEAVVSMGYFGAI